MKTAPRLTSVDGLRAMAMLMVFTFHTWQFAGSPHLAVHVGDRSFETVGNALMGANGVSVFIVLSGFCLFFPLCFDEERLRHFDWKNYAVRRVRRIAPPYYATIVYVLLLRILVAAGRHLMGRANVESSFPSGFDLLTHLTFTHTLFESTFFGFVAAHWSLGLEAQFYVMFPLVVWAFSRFGTRAIAALMLISLGYHAITHMMGVQDKLTVANFFLGRWLEFGVGMATALLVAHATKRGIKTPTWVGFALLVVCLLLFLRSTPASAPDWGPLLDQQATIALQLSAAVGLLLFVVCTSTPPVIWAWSNRSSAFLGLVSYSFFLIHQQTMGYLSQTLLILRPQMSALALFATLMTVGFPLCLAITCVFFRLFEKPFLKSWPLAGLGKKRETSR